MWEEEAQFFRALEVSKNFLCILGGISRIGYMYIFPCYLMKMLQEYNNDVIHLLLLLLCC